MTEEEEQSLPDRIDAAADDAERLCAELKGQISRAQRLVDEAKSFLEEAGHVPPKPGPPGDA